MATGMHAQQERQQARKMPKIKLTSSKNKNSGGSLDSGGTRDTARSESPLSPSGADKDDVDSESEKARYATMSKSEKMSYSMRRESKLHVLSAPSTPSLLASDP